MNTGGKQAPNSWQQKVSQGKCSTYKCRITNKISPKEICTVVGCKLLLLQKEKLELVNKSVKICSMLSIGYEDKHKKSSNGDQKQNYSYAATINL